MRMRAGFNAKAGLDKSFKLVASGSARFLGNRALVRRCDCEVAGWKLANLNRASHLPEGDLTIARQFTESRYCTLPTLERAGYSRISLREITLVLGLSFLASL